MPQLGYLGERPVENKTEIKRQADSGYAPAENKTDVKLLPKTDLGDATARDSGGKRVQSTKPLADNRLHRRFLSRNSMQFLSRSELHEVSNMFETSAISRRQNRRWFTRVMLKLQFRARQKLHRVARQKTPLWTATNRNLKVTRCLLRLLSNLLKRMRLSLEVQSKTKQRHQ